MTYTNRTPMNLLRTHIPNASFKGMQSGMMCTNREMVLDCFPFWLQWISYTLIFIHNAGYKGMQGGMWHRTNRERPNIFFYLAYSYLYLMSILMVCRVGECYNKGCYKLIHGGKTLCLNFYTWSCVIGDNPSSYTICHMHGVQPRGNTRLRIYVQFILFSS